MRAAWEIDDYFPPGVWLSPMLRALTEVNIAYLRARPMTPALYQSGIRYREDPAGTERWWDIPTIMRKREGADCKKLACWRAAELRTKGVDATALPVMQSMANGVILVHVVVELPDGRTEDPSRILGMR